MPSARLQSFASAAFLGTLSEVRRVRFEGDPEAVALADVRFAPKWLLQERDDIRRFTAIEEIAEAIKEAAAEGRNWTAAEHSKVQEIVEQGVKRWAIAVAADSRVTGCTLAWKHVTPDLR